MNTKIKLYENTEFNIKDKQYDIGYPLLDDPSFNIKISEKKEFNEHKYNGEINKDIEKQSKLCDSGFELAPHQLFVKNFLSNITPYNSLLLYHGLGTGKTCSAIGVCEEMRSYMKQLGIKKKIIIVASPAVQKNFELQLFDERKLTEKNGIWTLEGCTKNSFLKEVNPTNILNINRKVIISQIKKIIDHSYTFLGYSKFANFISRKITIPESAKLSTSERHKYLKTKLSKLFDNTLIVIDEVHNIRINEENTEKKISENLIKLVKYVNNVKLLLLSATPMYNSYKEIIWLVNLMNKNDKRSQIKIADVFNKKGDFKEGGKELLLQKIIGYISFVKGNNPYIFPYRIYPVEFDKSYSSYHVFTKKKTYPMNDFFNNKITEPIKYLDIYLNNLEEYQFNVYNHILNQFKLTEDEVLKKGYTVTLNFIYALNMVYPLKNYRTEDFKKLIGNEGLERIMKHKKISVDGVDILYNYDYTPEIKKEFGEIFHPDKISNYSKKISTICDKINKSTGVVLIYSQYISGGLIPMSLALESMGYSRYGTKYNLLKNNKENDSKKKYVLITGDKRFSLNNEQYLKALTNDNNKDGEKIKVVLISKTGAEGLDFKFIRQVHILEPWFNMNRIEQIIGRAVRTCSHKLLPLNKRNVSIFMHGSVYKKEKDLELVDMYTYRQAEKKSIKIGRVTRLLKEGSIDCNLNIEQQNFTDERFNHSLKQTLFNNKKITIKLGDKKYTDACDYMDSCLYTCSPSISTKTDNLDTYNISHIKLKQDSLKEKIKLIFKEHFALHEIDLLQFINVKKKYSKDEIYNALNVLVNNKNEVFSDKYNRYGYLINVGDYFIFQPNNIKNKKLDMSTKITLPDYKKRKINISLQKKKEENKTDITDLISRLVENYKIVFELKKIKSDKSWYKMASDVYYHLLEKDYDKDILSRLLIYHQVEALDFNNKKALLNYLYNNKDITEYEGIILEYFKNNIIKTEFNEFICFVKDTNVFLIKKDNGWEQASQANLIEVFDSYSSLITNLNKRINTYIGYYSNNKDNEMVFKVQDRTNLKNKGARSDQLSKTQLLSYLNKFTSKDEYTKETTRGIISNKLSIYLEILIRYKEYTKKDDTRYFLTPEEEKSINLKN